MKSQTQTPAFYISIVSVLVAVVCVGLLIVMANDPRRTQSVCTIVPEYVRCPYSPEAFALPEEVPPENGDLTLEDSMTSVSVAGVDDALNGRPVGNMRRKPQGRSYPLSSPAVTTQDGIVVSSPTSPIASEPQERDTSLLTTLAKIIQIIFEDSDPHTRTALLAIISKRISEERDPKTKLHMTAYLEIVASAAMDENLAKEIRDIAKLKDNVGPTNEFRLVIDKQMEGTSNNINKDGLPIINNPAVVSNAYPTGEEFDLTIVKSNQGYGIIDLADPVEEDQTSSQTFDVKIVGAVSGIGSDETGDSENGSVDYYHLDMKKETVGISKPDSYSIPITTKPAVMSNAANLPSEASFDVEFRKTVESLGGVHVTNPDDEITAKPPLMITEEEVHSLSAQTSDTVSGPVSTPNIRKPMGRSFPLKVETDKSSETGGFHLAIDKETKGASGTTNNSLPILSTGEEFDLTIVKSEQGSGFNDVTNLVTETPTTNQDFDVKMVDVVSGIGSSDDIDDGVLDMFHVVIDKGMVGISTTHDDSQPNSAEVSKAAKPTSEEFDLTIVKSEQGSGFNDVTNQVEETQTAISPTLDKTNSDSQPIVKSPEDDKKPDKAIGQKTKKTGSKKKNSPSTSEKPPVTTKGNKTSGRNPKTKKGPVSPPSDMIELGKPDIV